MKDLVRNISKTQAECVKFATDSILKGKKIRAALCILSFMLCKNSHLKYQSQINSALAMELIHNATLLHDDVVDNNHIRRGVQNTKSLFGNKASVLVGDFVLSAAFALLIECNNINAVSLLSKTASKLSQGEIKQLELSGKIISHPQYLEIVGAKTASLFSASCQVASIITAKTEYQESLKKFGYAVGMAFQIQDDILDYTADTTLGKKVGTDFLDCKFTLPCIFAYKNAKSKQEKDFWEKDFFGAKKNYKQALELMHESDAITSCKQLIAEYINQAKQSLQGVKDSIYKDSLRDCLEFALNREC